MRLQIATLALPLLLAVAPAMANDARKVDRLTDALVQAVPIGTVMEMMADQDPNWPVQDKPGAVNKGELACLRDELSEEGLRRNKRREVVRYVAENPGRVDGDLALLERGAARIFGTLMLAGAEAEQTGVPADEEALLAKFSPAETESLLTLMTDPAYRPLRVVAGIDGGFDANQSAAENEEKGEQMGMDLATRIMMAALDTCGVEPERLR